MTSLGIQKKNFEYQDKSIVDCPSCLTRFFVKNEILSKHSEPNFHCSRCDYVFKVDLAKIGTNTQSIQNPPPIVNEPFKEEAAISAAASPVSKISETKVVSSSKIFKIDKEKARDNFPSYSAPHESTISEDIFPSKNISNETQSSPLVTSPADTKSRRKIKALSLLKNVGIFAKSASRQKTRKLASEQLNSTYQAGSSRITINYWQDLLSISTPIFVFLLTLSLITFYFVSNPSAASSIISAIVPSSPRTAPTGLHIMQSDFSKVVLDSGEKIALISGEIQNNTDQKFGAVKLEAQAFDRNGALIKKTLTNSGSVLVNTRVKSLSPKMIETILSQQGPKNLTIAPNKSERFAIALLGDEMKSAAYFSVRIYSVRAQS